MASRVAKQNILGEPKVGVSAPKKGCSPAEKKPDSEGEKQKKQ